MYEAKAKDLIGVALEPWQQALLEAANVIREQGLAKCRLGMPGEARCALGAILQATGEDKEWRMTNPDLYYSVLKKFRSYVGIVHIPAWNNVEERTAAEVIAAMEACALGGGK